MLGLAVAEAVPAPATAVNEADFRKLRLFIKRRIPR
jgi:hypothetical protein